MREERTCLRCGSTNLKAGEVQSTGKIYCRPRNAKLATVFTTGALVRSNVCFDCGHVELVADVNEVRSLEAINLVSKTASLS